MSSGISFEWVPAVVTFRLHGPPGAMLDRMLAILVNAGHSAEVIEPGTAYRISGDRAKLTAIGLQVGIEDGAALEVEVPGDRVVLSAQVAPKRAYRRSVYVMGEGLALTLVARAVDAGLHVEAAGSLRWRASGPTASLMLWLAVNAHKTTLEETLKLWNMTPEQVALEDSEAEAPVVRVALPERRRVTTAIKRNDDGAIVSVSQTETDDDEIDD